MENNFETPRGKLLGGGTKVLAVLGFVAILAIGLWGSVQVAKAVPGAFSSIASAIVSFTSIFVGADETITLSSPTFTVGSGEKFVLTWEHAKKSVEGSYTFRYNCADGVYFNSPSRTGAETTVFCNIPFNFLNSQNSIVLTPVSEKNRFIDVEMFIDFTPNGASVATVTGQAVLTVINENLSSSPTLVPTTPTTPTTPTVPTTPTTPVAGNPSSSTHLIGSGAGSSNPNGYVDLTARVLEIGYVDKSTGAFTASSTPRRNERVAVRFAVENLGTKTSPQFDFNAVLPTIPTHVFSAPMQQELRPGDRIEFTIGFDSFVDANEGTLIINIDPSNRINEKNKDNNIIRYVITVVR